MRLPDSRHGRTDFTIAFNHNPIGNAVRVYSFPFERLVCAKTRQQTNVFDARLRPLAVIVTTEVARRLLSVASDILDANVDEGKNEKQLNNRKYSPDAEQSGFRAPHRSTSPMCKQNKAATADEPVVQRAQNLRSK